MENFAAFFFFFTYLFFVVIFHIIASNVTKNWSMKSLNDADWDSDSLVTQWWLSFSESLSDEAEEQRPIFVTLGWRQFKMFQEDTFY